MQIPWDVRGEWLRKKLIAALSRLLHKSQRFESGSAAAVVGSVVLRWTIDRGVKGSNPPGFEHVLESRFREESIISSLEKF